MLRHRAAACQRSRPERAGDGGQSVLRHRPERHAAGRRPRLHEPRPRECGMVTGETAFKWGELRPKADVWDWKPADAVMAFAARRGIQVRGHTLLWHEHNPKWLVDELTPANAERLLTDAHQRRDEPLPRPHRAVGRGERGAGAEGRQAVRLPRYALVSRHGAGAGGDRVPRLCRGRSAAAALHQRFRAGIHLAGARGEAAGHARSAGPDEGAGTFRCRVWASRRIWRPA